MGMGRMAPSNLVGEDRRIRVTRIAGQLSTWILVIVMTLVAVPNIAAAQYGGVSGLFVTISPSDPTVADFTGLGCTGGDEVVLYLPGVLATSADPPSSQSVPGRVLAVTTARSSANEVEDGTFAFLGIQLPSDLEPGTYIVGARCGDVDLRVLVRVDALGAIALETDPEAPTNNQIPEALPFTGRNADRLVSLGAGLVALGFSLGAYARRQRT